MKIIVTDGYVENPGDLSWAPLEALGEVTYYDRIGLTDEEETIRRIGDAEIAVINKAPVTRKVIDSCPNLKLITVLATGYNVVDVAYAKEKGIPVCNVPNYGGYSVSQFTIALMLEACLHIGHHDRTVHEGKWQNSPDWCYWDYPLIELAGKTFGLLGCGRIGIHTAEAAKGLGMHVIAYNRSQSQAAKDLGVEFVDLDGLFARSDVLALQMPLADFNVGIINKENIAKMKDGVIIINNSRGQMVVEQDPADALNSGKVAFAGLDVVSTEPIRADNPLLLQIIHQPCRAVIADAELSLEHGNRCLFLFQNQINCLREKFIRILRRTANLAGSGNLVDGFLCIIGLAALFQKIDNSFDLLICHKCALQTGRLALSRRIEQHIALSEQFLRAVHINNGTGIHSGRDGKSNSRRNICLDHTGDDIDRWSLRRNHQMNARCTRQLGQTTDRIFYFARRYHHQIGKLIHDNDDLWQFLRFLRIVEIAHAVFCKLLVTVGHLCHRPVEGAGRLFRVGHNRNQKMRNTVVYT